MKGTDEMAQLKKVDDYQSYPIEDPNLQDNPQIEQPKRPNSEIVAADRLPVSSLRHLKRLSRMEKFILAIIVFGTLAASILTIQLRANITQIQNEITTIENKVTEKQHEATELEQERTELSRADRLKEIAEANGLEIKDDNLRNVN